MIWLKQSTAVTVMIGPFIDDTDGKTAETGLTISQADVRLSKNAGNMAQKGDATSCTHDELGYYTCPLSTTDTNTLGVLRLMVHEGGALPVWQDYMVVPANVWDSYFGADKLQVHAAEITANLITAAAIADGAIDAATFAAGAITAAAIATDAIDDDALAANAVTAIQSGLSTVTTAQVNAEVVDALSVDTYAELGSMPAATSPLATMIRFVFTQLRNIHLTTASADSVRNDADSATLWSAPLSDDGTTFTRGEYS